MPKRAELKLTLKLSKRSKKRARVKNRTSNFAPSCSAAKGNRLGQIFIRTKTMERQICPREIIPYRQTLRPLTPVAQTSLNAHGLCKRETSTGTKSRNFRSGQQTSALLWEAWCSPPCHRILRSKQQISEHRVSALVRALRETEVAPSFRTQC